MSYEITKTLPEIRIAVRARTVVGLYFESVKAMMEVLRQELPPKNGPTSKRTIDAIGKDRAELMVAFLNKVLAQCYLNKETYLNVAFKKLTEVEIIAELEGSGMAKFDQDIASVQVEGAIVTKTDEGEWQADYVCLA